MDTCKIIDLKKTILEDNDADAERLREELREIKTFYLNVMSSPGSGKTSTLLKTIACLKNQFSIGVMEADIEATVDAEKMEQAGVRSIQVHTGGQCAMDAEMTMQAMEKFHTEDLDLLFLENVGNLVCPAETDTGASRNVMILSVPEGHDKPLKYPLMFQVSDVMIISKMDVMPYFDFDIAKVTEYVRRRNPDIQIIPVSATTGEGMEDWIKWLETNIKEWNQ